MPRKKITLNHDREKINCISCGAVINENYCSVCGEKRLEIHDLKLQHFVEESFEGITHFDNKFFRSVKLLITRPGQLAEYFYTGKRVSFMRPFALFFVCNLLFFLIVGPNNVFSLPLDSFYHYKPYTNFHTKEIVAQIVSNDDQYAAVATTFNEKMGVQSKAFLAFFIPFLALAGLAMKRKIYLAGHLVFSTHFFSFIVLYYTFCAGIISALFYYFTNQNYNSTYDITYSLFSLLVFMTYYFFAAKRFYKVSTFTAILGAILSAFLFLIVLYGYRFLLFFKIISGIHLVH